MTTAIAKVNYTHDAMIDLIIANPAIKQGELARHFGYTPGWVSQVMSSDAFKEKLAGRKSELVDPGIISTIEGHMEALCRQSLAVVTETLETTRNSELALKALQLSSQALGYGAKDRSVMNQQNNFIVVAPEKATSTHDWLMNHTPVGKVIDAGG